jgi:hypothetical protein
VQGHVAEFGCAPENDVLGEARQIHADHREHEGCLGGEVARRRGVDGVVGRRVEAELLGDRVGIEVQ